MTGTFLASTFDANALAMRVASVAGAVVGGSVKIDNEFMKIVQIADPMVYVRERGGEGGVAADHGVNASVTFFTGAEMPPLGTGEMVPAPTDNSDAITASADGVLAWNQVRRDTTVTIAKAAVANLTLEAPSAASDGVRLTITSQTAFAHVVTATGLIDDGATGGAKNTLTFAAFPGANVVLQSNRAHWTVLTKSGVTVG
jgi:hypothetical protein